MSSSSTIPFGKVQIWWQEGEKHYYPVHKYAIEYQTHYDEDDGYKWRLLKSGIVVFLVDIITVSAVVILILIIITVVIIINCFVRSLLSLYYTVWSEQRVAFYCSNIPTLETERSKRRS